MLVAIGFVLVVAALAYLWQRQETLIAQPPAVDPAAFAGLQADVHALQPRLAQVEQRATADVRPLEARIAALERRPAPPPVDLKPLEDRIAALENKPAPPPVDLKPLEERIAALENKPAPDVAGAVAAAVTPLDKRLGTVEQGQQATAKAAQDAVAQTQAAVAQLADRVAAMEKQLAAAEQRQAQQARQETLALRAQAALTALEAGKPLGDIPGAPPAVAKFAAAKPPSEAELRLAFPAAAARAIDASAPNNKSLSLGERMLQHAETLITVRKGDKVLVGTTAAETLGQAQAQLDSGDLAGCLATLNGLDPGAAQAMAGWKAQAQALLDARTALNAMTAPASR